MNLLQYCKNFRSQYGEDGIIEKVFNIVKPKYKLFVETGAWDGEHLSNTYNLYKNHNWRGLYIEANKRKFKILKNKFLFEGRIITKNIFVESVGNNSLQNILIENNFPHDFDLLSIDIDGNEYEVWENLKKFAPTLVIIEYNPTIPPYYEFIDRGGKSFMGSSCLALYNLGKKKGYELICTTEANCFFIKKEFFPIFNIKDNSPENLQNKESLCFVALNHSGEIVFEKDIFKGNKIKFIVYHRIKKFIKHFLMRKKSFYFIGEKYNP